MRFLLVSLMAVSAVLAGSVTHTLDLSPRDVVMSQSDNYSVVQLELNRDGMRHAWTTEPGEPLLPVVSGNVLIPAGAELENITVTELERVEIGTGITVHPVQPMRPLCEFNSVPFVEPDRAVYGANVAYPTEDLVRIPAGNKTGYRIAGFLYCPFEYYPSSGRLVLVSKAKVTVTYREHAVEVPVLTPGQRDWAATDVAALVVNPDDVSRMAPPAAEKDAGEVDVVIFTNSALAASLEPFRGWLMRKGYFTEIVRYDTLSTTGRDNQEKMREYLKMMFADKGLKYVMGGDYDKCPHRNGYLPYSTYNIPAEMYFGDLDGSWDANGNNNFGEMTGDSVDLFHDIYVGRLPLDDAADAANFLHKDTTYEITPDTGYLDNVLLPAEVLWSNIDFHGMIVNKNIARLLNDRSPWTVDSGINMGPANVIAAVNEGQQLFHFAGHGSNTAFGSTFNTGHISSLTNIAKPCITMTMACHCGWFDTSSDCLGEMLVNATNGGSVSTMFNARYGWGAPPTQGPNSNMNCAFFRNFTRGMTQGKAHGLARDFLRNESFSQMTMRWAMYTNTLQGDPTMMMWRQVPQVLQSLHVDSMAAMPQTFTVQIDCGDEAVPGARVAVTTPMGELIGRATTNADGVAYVVIDAIEDTATVLNLTVTAQDLYIYEAEIGVGAACGSPLIVIDHCTIDDFNGRLDPGEETDVYFVVKNNGNLVADSVVGNLTTTSPYVTITQGRSDYGTVSEGDTSKGEAYQVRVHRDAPHGHRAEFTLGATSPDGVWSSGCELVVGLPHARGGFYATLDTGNYACGIFGNGGIGTSQWRGEGFGLIYPKARTWSAASMMHGSFMMGTDTNWVVDNYYGAPNWKECPLDFQTEESVRIVYPPELGDQEYIAVFSDEDHPEPRDVSITHRAYGSADPDHADFIILEYRIHNNETDALENLYTGVACDFRTPAWNQNDQYDYAGTDSVRQIGYVRSALSGETLAVGISHIYPAGMNAYANCLFHDTHINNGFTKAEKMMVMDGTIRQTTGTTRGNYHCVASSGPYTIPAGDSQIVTYVICGGRTVTQMEASYDTALAWYDPPVGVAEGERPALVRGMSIAPRLFTDAVRVHYSLSRIEPVEVFAFDATGRVADRYTFTPAARAGEFTWRPKMAPGVYFVQVGDASEKVLKLR